MIGSLRGTLLERSGIGEVLIETAGVGYRVTVSPSTVVELGSIGDEVFVYIHHHFRDDAQTLYGFLTRDERVCFETLLGAHGVGPGLALAILSVYAPLALQRVLLDDDVNALCLVPGIGKKTAARLLVELKSRLDVADYDEAISSGVIGSTVSAGSSPRADVRDALTSLGYDVDEVNAVLRELPDDTGDSAALLKQALQSLAIGAKV